MRTSLTGFVALMFLVPAGCGEDGPSAPAPWSGAESYACDEWRPERPDAATVLVDVAVPYDASSPDRASEAQLQMLRDHGASVRHVFNVPLVRVAMAIDSVEVLGRHREIAYALGVPDVDSHRIDLLIVAYAREVGLADSTALQDLGVAIRAEILGTYFSVSAEDGVIPLIRELPGVRGVGLDDFACRNAGEMRTSNGPLQPPPARGE